MNTKVQDYIINVKRFAIKVQISAKKLHNYLPENHKVASFQIIFEILFDWLISY